MSTFAVILNEPNERVAARIRDAYPAPDHVRISPTAFLVSGEMPVRELAERAGLVGDGEIEGAVGIALRLNGAYSGKTYDSIWEWFELAERVRQPA